MPVPTRKPLDFVLRWTRPFQGGSFQFFLENPESYFLTRILYDDGSYSDSTVGRKNNSKFVPQEYFLRARDEEDEEFLRHHQF